MIGGFQSCLEEAKTKGLLRPTSNRLCQWVTSKLMVYHQFPFQMSYNQWPFQEPKMEVSTIYKAYVRPM